MYFATFNNSLIAQFTIGDLVLYPEEGSIAETSVKRYQQRRNFQF